MEELKWARCSVSSCDYPFCGLTVIFCGFISHLIGHETINIPEIFSGVHGFTGKTVKKIIKKKITTSNDKIILIIYGSHILQESRTMEHQTKSQTSMISCCFQSPWMEGSWNITVQSIVRWGYSITAFQLSKINRFSLVTITSAHKYTV